VSDDPDVARRRDPSYKPEWKPHPVRDTVRALGRTLREYALLMRLHRPIGIWLLLWPALWGLWFAGEGRPDARLLLVAVVLWAAVYDTMYAMVDREDDLRIGVKSTAILFGEADRAIIVVMMAMMLLALWLAGREAGLGDWYRGGLAAAALLFLYELWLIRRREPARCFQAFNNNHFVGMVVFIGLALDYLSR
jgi:4-hydroxybenzoate polyprenyltransferase